MCLGPELILPMVIGTALSAGGTMIQQGEHDANAKRVADARNAVLVDTLSKNDRISDQTRGAFAANSDSYKPEAVAQRQSAEEAARTASADEVATLPEGTPTTADSPDIVNREVAKRLAGAVAKGKEKAKASAKLGAFGDQWFKAGLGTDAAGRDIGMQSGFANANLGLLPHLQDFAENKAYQPVSPIGALLQGAGNTVGSAAGSGYFKPKVG